MKMPPASPVTVNTHPWITYSGTSRTYLVDCGPCLRFLRNTFNGGLDRSSDNEEHSAMFCSTENMMNIQMLPSVGNKVNINDKSGIVDYFTVTGKPMAPDIHMVVTLDDGTHFGNSETINGRRYFRCTNGHRIFLKFKDAASFEQKRLHLAPIGNSMFPSWAGICKCRKKREDMLKKRSVSPTKLSIFSQSTNVCSQNKRTHQLRGKNIRNNIASNGSLLLEQNNQHQSLTQHGKGKHIFRECLSVSDDSTRDWSENLMKKWCFMYNDPHKATLMGKTLAKLCTAYNEGLTLRQNSSAEDALLL